MSSWRAVGFFVLVVLFGVIGFVSVGCLLLAGMFRTLRRASICNTERVDTVCWFVDFYGWLSPAELFNLADSKPHMVQIIGGFLKFTSKAIVITSNKIPEQWWKRQTVDKYDMEAFNRRITLTWTWRKNYEEQQFGYKFNYQLTSE